MSARIARTVPAKYVETGVRIQKECPEKGYALGTADINGVMTEVLIPSNAHASQIGPNWDTTTTNPHTPIEGSVLFAQICTQVAPGKKPYAVYWRLGGPLPDIDPCDDCGLLWDCRCPPKRQLEPEY